VTMRPMEKSETFGDRVKWTERLYDQVRQEFLTVAALGFGGFGGVSGCFFVIVVMGGLFLRCQNLARRYGCSPQSFAGPLKKAVAADPQAGSCPRHR